MTCGLDRSSIELDHVVSAGPGSQSFVNHVCFGTKSVSCSDVVGRAVELKCCRYIDLLANRVCRVTLVHQSHRAKAV